jgi:hypothetical protein
LEWRRGQPIAPPTKDAAALTASLQLIADAATVFQDRWLLIGSAAAHVAGADVGAIADIDLLLSERDINALDVHWRDRKRLDVQPSDRFRSQIFHRFDAPLPIEAMAGFELKAPNGDWIRLAPKTRMPFGAFYATSLSEQVEILKLMRREKDAPRILALKKMF